MSLANSTPSGASKVRVKATGAVIDAATDEDEQDED
jgi:hypothetical protein